MNTNEFVLTFQYDEDQAETRSPDKSIKRLLESLGGEVVDVFEAYGMVDVTCHFTGTPEQAQKIANDVLSSNQQKNIKMSHTTLQKYYILGIENVDVNAQDEMIKQLRSLVRPAHMSRVNMDSLQDSNLIISIPVKSDYEQLKEPILAIVRQFLPNCVTYEDKDNHTLSEGNNYSDKKKNVL